MSDYEEIGEVYRLTQPDTISQETPPYENPAEQTIRRLEANRALPSRRSNPSTLNRRKKPLSERLTELREEREMERRHRRAAWSCCHRAAFCIRGSITSYFTSCWGSVVWWLRAACSCTCTCSIWGNPISQIEGYLGSHVSTYFKAMVWLLKINLVCMVLGLGLIVAPGVYLKTTSDVDTLYNMNSTCYNTDIIPGESRDAQNFNSVLQFFTGTGWMEATPVFIGWYPPGSAGHLNLSYAYLAVILAYFIISIVVISSNVSTLFNRSAVETVEYKPYSDIIFMGWDYHIKSDSRAELTRATLTKSLKEQLAKDAQFAKRRSPEQNVCIAIWRLVTNTVYLAAMAAFFYVLITYGGLLNTTVATTCALQSTEDETSMVFSKLQELWVQYAPSVIIAVSNTIFPSFFKLLGYMELYRLESNRVIVTMVRSLIMKLSTLCTLLYLVYKEVESSARHKHSTGREEEMDSMTLSYSDLNCWETHLAAQLYQLWIIHYVVFFAYIMIRKILTLIVKKCFGRTLDVFDITEEILDLCYKQMIVWSIFPVAPLMTVFAVLESVVAFYVKRWVALSSHSRTMVLTSHTVNVVNALFLLSLLSIFIFYGVMTGNFAPSPSCTPFRGYASFGDLFVEMTTSLGEVQTYLIATFRSVTATVIIIVVFSLILYYYKCAGDSKNVKIRLLEERIRMEQRDKAFLLTKICNRAKGSVCHQADEFDIDRVSVDNDDTHL